MFEFSSPLFWYKLVFTAELLIAEALATYTLARRRHFALRAVLSAAVVFAAAFLYPVAFGNAVFNALFNSVMFLTLFALTVLALKCCYDEKFVTLVFCCVIAYTTQHIAYSTYNFLINVFDIGNFNIYGSASGDVNDFSALAVPVYLGVYGFAYWFVWAFVEHKLREQEKLIVNVPLLFCFAGILAVDVVLNAFVTANAGEEADIVSTAVVYVYSVMSCSFALGMLYSVLGKRLAESELETVEELWRQDKKNYELSRENIEQINIKCHDLKHQIRRLGADGGRVSGEYLKGLEAAVNIYDTSVKTGNPALDLLIAENSIYMAKYGIRLSAMVDGEALSLMSESDIYSLFGNALRNAFEALVAEPDKDKRVVHMRVRKAAGMLAIDVENSCGEVRFGEDGLPVTDKSGAEHGYGMRSMRLIAQKYGGSLNAFVEDGMFCLGIFLPLPKSNGERNKSYGERPLSISGDKCYHSGDGGESHTSPNNEKGEMIAMAEGKKKMSNRRFITIIAIAMALLLAVMLTVTIVMNYFSQTMDAYLGRGARSVTNVEGAEDWDTDYYEQKYETSPEARDAAAKVAAKISDNGIVLLKNDGCLPLAKTTRVTPMGYRYLDPIYGGSGSGNVNSTEDYVVTPEEGVAAVFGDINNAVVTAMKEAEDELEAANPVNGADGGSDNYSGARTSVPEYPEAIYEGVANTMKDTVGLVYIGRVGGEGGDLCATEYDDGTVHELALTARERALLELAKKNCSEVIVILDTSNAMQVPELEDDEKIGAILEIGGPGCSGFGSLGRILVGDVNPSGRLVDTWAADFTKDPVYVNFDKSITNNVSDGIMNYTNAIHTYQTPDGVTVNYNIPFREYEEGVYMGYRYYETAASLGYFTSDDLPDGVTDPYYNRENGVVYPFGFGLSYTTFTQEITDMDVSEADNRLTVTVEVVNTGDKDGRDTVQLYYSAPYTDFDVTNMIEKPSVVLGEYAKTGVLKADGGKETVTIELALDEMASYCFTRKNGDGTTGAYVLEGGKYGVSIRSDSHTVLDSDEFEISETVWYDNDNIRPSEIAAQSALDAKGEPLGYPAAGPDAEFTAATNKYEKSNAYMTDDSISEATILSRSNWEATQPTGATDADRMASEEVVEWMEWNAGAFDYETDEVLGNVSGSLAYKADKPVSGADNKLTLADMRGLDYYDDNWDILLDQLDYTDTDELKLALFMGGYTTGEVTTIGKPLTVDRDGPQGLTQSSNDGSSWLGNVCAYPSEVVLAQTWDRDLAYEYGYSVGQEALTNGTNGWYAPGVNMHRSPFAGRNFEYFSEDPIVTGIMGTAVVSGAGDCGVYCAFKHFALNDQEAQRQPDRSFDITVWATEQAIREIYLKPGEMMVKNARKTIKYIADDEGNIATKTMRAADAIMVGDASPGGEYTGYSYALLNGIIRGEWGFQGFMITDMHVPYENECDKLVRAGCDVLMTMTYLSKFSVSDTQSATGQWALRNAIKNVSFTVVNSNAMQGAAPGAIITYAMSPWAVGLLIGDIVIGLLIVAGAVWIVLRVRDSKKNPEKYKGTEKI